MATIERCKGILDEGQDCPESGDCVRLWPADKAVLHGYEFAGSLGKAPYNLVTKTCEKIEVVEAG